MNFQSVSIQNIWRVTVSLVKSSAPAGATKLTQPTWLQSCGCLREDVVWPSDALLGGNRGTESERSYRWPWRSRSRSSRSLLMFPWRVSYCHLRMTGHPIKGEEVFRLKKPQLKWEDRPQSGGHPTWKSSALLLARSALFPARAITMLGLACLWSSLTQFFARTNDSCQTKNGHVQLRHTHSITMRPSRVNHPPCYQGQQNHVRYQEV